MARRKFNGGCAITCDVKRDGCHERFTTYSYPSVARKQKKPKAPRKKKAA